ncbi:MAG: hypothetical protein PHF37_02655 [Phycisphaerae bacterium]|nr:hypothetical protein [Phycisphaerae bacterium]
MRNFLITLFCLALLCGWAHAYNASGKIYNNTIGTPTPVTGGSGSIKVENDTSSAEQAIVTNVATNNWSGGWSSANCTGWTVTVKAQNATNTAWGSKSWVAQNNTETGKDIYIKNIVAINPNLGFGLAGEQFVAPGIQAPSTAVLVVSGQEGVEVQEFTAQIKYDKSKMEVDMDHIFDIDSFFDITFQIDIPEPGTITLHGTGPVPLMINPGEERELVNIQWSVPLFETRDLTVVDSNFQIMLPPAPNNMAVPHQTEYVIGDISQSSPYFLIEDQNEWQEALNEKEIVPMTPDEFEGYIKQWQDMNDVNGLPYPDGPFITPELYVYEGNEPGPEPNDAGLVMKWGDPTTTDGNYTAAFKYDYKLDPDYSNCILKITVTAPQFSPVPPFSQVNKVSLGLQNIPAVGGPVRAWYWDCGPGKPIQWGVPTTITIDMSKTGVTAATPTATSYLNNPGFNIKAVQWILVDENATWVGGSQPAPPPGGGLPGMWNYWHNLSVSPKIGTVPGEAVDSKWFIKYSQKPELFDPNAQPPLINGWDELSDYNGPPTKIMADDWLCEDDRPVTDVHWWGSFIGWNQPNPPPIVPKAFHIGIWTDVAVNDPLNQKTYSHPGQLVWENYCTTAVWNFAGYDVDPFDRPNRENETCFQYAQFLSQDQWFYQEPNESGTNVYWLSIAPVYNPQDYTDPNFHPWGWKTRPHIFNDDACSIIATQNGTWPPALFDFWFDGTELKGPDSATWDLAFELTTNEPGPIPSADLDYSGRVDLTDFAIMASQWLTAGP